jgi:hypothetical protein
MPIGKPIVNYTILFTIDPLYNKVTDFTRFSWRIEKFLFQVDLINWIRQLAIHDSTSNNFGSTYIGKTKTVKLLFQDGF